MIGPGSVRVARLVGRLGVVSMPLVGAGLDLDERVIRRHVAKLEAEGWLLKRAGLWGEGSLLYLTRAGLDGVGLSHLRPIRGPVNWTVVHRRLGVALTAARFERRGYEWRSVMELEDGPKLCAVPAQTDHGFTTVIPDLLVRDLNDDRQTAVIVHSGMRRHDRQKMILAGWRNALRNGLYDCVQYECANPSFADALRRCAQEVGLVSGSAFAVHVQEDADAIRGLVSLGSEDQLTAAHESKGGHVGP